MYSFRAGAIAPVLILLMLASAALGQAAGGIESIGFENNYRPECWTPMLVTLSPQTSESGQYQLQVKQEDLDRDYPIFVRTISLTGNAEGAGARQQKFRMYFKPQPTGEGLPDANDPGRTLRDLQDVLQASFCTESGKWLAPLPMTTTIINVEPKTSSFSYRRGMRFILTVHDGTANPAWTDYQRSVGILEDPLFVKVQPRDLPESVLGYDAVDTVVWLNADPNELKRGTDEKFRALESYVRRGGTLIICTPNDWQKMLSLGELLPVTITGTDTLETPDPLRSIARSRGELRTGDGWDSAIGPFTLARATLKPGASAHEWIRWKGENDRTPWLVRKPHGAGAITWVAQNLGDPSLTRGTQGWPRIWDRVLDLRNQTLTVTPQTTDGEKNRFGQATGVDLGYSLLSGMDLTSKSAWLITLAVVFFIGYWLVAGPGMYAYLAARKQTSASWFLFAASALGATLLTVVVVRVTLRGDPELRHASLVRIVGNEPAVVYSRFGLYIPRDGTQQIELKDMAPGSMAAISAFGIHPQHLDSANVPNDPGPEYTVMVRDADSQEPASVRVPYRTSLKKFEADWTGNAGGRVEGSARLLASGGMIEGTLTNGTGKTLRNIYIAFRYPQPNADQDWILFMPRWDAGITINLNEKFSSERLKAAPVYDDKSPTPERGGEIVGQLRNYWQMYWYAKLTDRSLGLGERRYDDFSGGGVRASIPLLSFFSRLQPTENQSGVTPSRFELLRRGARRYDVSAAVGAGSLVVVAQSDDNVPLPMPIEVEGRRVAGSGLTVFQFILPLDSSAVGATTQPAD